MCSFRYESSSFRQWPGLGHIPALISAQHHRETKQVLHTNYVHSFSPCLSSQLCLSSQFCLLKRPPSFRLIPTTFSAFLNSLPPPILSLALALDWRQGNEGTWLAWWSWLPPFLFLFYFLSCSYIYLVTFPTSSQF